MNYYRLKFGKEERYTLGDVMTVTPEWISLMMAHTERPDGYAEGAVSVNLQISDLAVLFGNVSVEAITKEEWHEGVSSLGKP